MKNTKDLNTEPLKWVWLHKRTWAMILGCLVLFSCDSFTEIDFPDSQLTGVEVFDSPATVNAAFASIYAKLRDEVLTTGNSGLNVHMGLYADEFDYYGASGEDTEFFFNHTVLASNSEVSNIWNDSYNLIYAVNSILSGLQNSDALTEKEKAEFRGEALFLRGYFHFYLVNLYGPIPYITTTDYRVNQKVSRMAEEEVYALIVQDLEEAKALLPKVSGPNRTKPTAIAAMALLARTHLYTKNYPLAEFYAGEVINSSGFSLGENTEKVFLKNSPSTIWQLQPKTGINTWEAFVFVFKKAPPPFVALNPEVVASFEAQDARSVNWMGEVSGGGNSYYYPFKYKELNSGSNKEYSVLFRLAEQVLIRAESRVFLGDLTGAKADLDQVRKRANLSPLTVNSDPELLQAIEQERLHELFSEHGHRWFDLKRWGRAGAVLAPIKLAWKPTDILLPLPESELALNPNLQPQNPGY